MGPPLIAPLPAVAAIVFIRMVRVAARIAVIVASLVLAEQVL